MNILSTYMHIDRVNLLTESLKDDSLEVQLQANLAKSHSCHSHDDY